MHVLIEQVAHPLNSEEFFYQLALRQFGDMSRLKLEPPPPVQTLVEIAVDAEDTSSSSLSKAEIAQARAVLRSSSYHSTF